MEENLGQNQEAMKNQHLSPRVWVSVLIIAVLAVGYFVSRTPSQPAGLREELTVDEQSEEQQIADEAGNPPSLAETVDAVINPFYQARFQSDPEKAFGFLGGNLGDEKFSIRDEVFNDLEEQGWLFISSSFESFKVLYSGVDRFDDYVFVVRIMKTDGTSQDELLSVSPDKISSSIYAIDFNPKGYEVLSYNDEPYLVLQSVKKNGSETTIAVLASRYFEPFCSGYVESTCDIFLLTGSKVEHIKELTELNQRSLFKWLEVDSDKLLYQQAFSEGGLAFQAVESLDVNSGDIEELVRRDYGANTDFSEVGYALFNDVDCFFNVIEPERLTKQGNFLEFVACGNEEYEQQTAVKFYLIVNDEIILERTLANDAVDDLERFVSFDLEKNALNGNRFEFTFLGDGYSYDLESAELSQL